MEVRDFFEAIFGDAEGYAFIGTLDDQKRLNNYKAFEYPTSLNTMVKYVEMRDDIDVYFSPMLYSVPRRSAKTVVATPVVYADTDEFDPTDYRVPPTFNVATSPIKTHSYWVLDRTDYPVEEVKEAARAIALTHAKKINGVQAGVDPSGWDLTQMLRVPGTWQTNPKNKPGYPEGGNPVTVLENSTGETYALDFIVEQYDPANLPAAPLSSDAELPETLPDAAEVLRKVMADDTLGDLYSKEPLGDWSEVLYLFCSEMFRQGFTPEEVLVAAWNSGANKYKRDGRPMEHLWRNDVLKAHSDPANRPIPKRDKEAIDREPARPKDEGISKEIEKVLIKEHERGSLTETYVDKYVRWAASKTDAPAPYHVAGAFTVLSCVLGEWGVAYPGFGDLRLGMFFVVMGETTKTRKSTARKLMKQVLRMTQVGDYEYIFSGDVTPETLLDALSEKPHQSSLYDRDEFQALVDDVKRKPYMKNFFETLNELYDGWARGRYRKEKKTKDTPVNFVQYAMGIRSQIQDNLELSDFTSGYLPRNIFVRGDSPPRVRGQNRLKQGDPSTAGVDREFMAVVKNIVDARNFWSARVGDRGVPERVMFDDDAWERWLDFQEDLEDYVMQHPRAEVLIPSVERLSFNVLKAATLFAMSDKRTKGSMVDVLNAIYYGAQWVEDLIIVAEGVSESLYKRELEKIEQYVIDKGGLVTYTNVLKWATSQGMRKKDLMEYLDHLTSDGTLAIVEDSAGKKSLELLDG